MLIYGKIFKIYYLKEGDIMEHEGKNIHPYKGVFGRSLILIIVPAFLTFCLFLVIEKYSKTPTNVNKDFAIMIGCGVGFLFQLSTALCGLLKGTFKVVITRIKNFFSNLTINFKFAIKYYWDDIKTEGIVFWIYFLIIGGTFGITLYGFINSFNYYLNYIKK